MKFVNLFFIVFFSHFIIQGQTEGTMVIHYDNGLESTISSYYEQIKELKPKGFRVQLCSESGNNARTVANSIKSQFLKEFSNENAYLIWESPNFKVRVGDFKTRLDATLFWMQLQPFFPQAYVVIDEINMQKID